MTNPSSPAAESELARAWRAVVASIKAGEPAFGERLYLLGAGPVPVEGAAGGAITLDSEGRVVLVVGLAEPSVTAAAQMARQLGTLGNLPGSKLREAGVDPDEGGGLRARHAAYFDLREPVELNSGQRCVLTLAAEPSGVERAALGAELGEALAGIFVAADGGVRPLTAAPAEPAAPEAEIVLEPEAEEPAEPEETVEPPVEAEPDEAVEELEVPGEGEAPAEAEAEPEVEVVETEPEEETEAEPEGPAEIEVALDETAEGEAVAVDTEEPAPDLVAPYLDDETSTVIVEESDAADELEARRFAGWPVGNWIGLTMILVGIGIGIIGVLNLNNSGDAPNEPQPNEEIRTVATDVTPDATHARWIGQQRVVTLSDGTLVFVYPTDGSLNLVKDGATSGASWEEPFELTEVPDAKSLSVDVDSKDRLHIAYSDGNSINYIRLKNKPSQWKPSRLIQIDDDTTSLQVDVAWDEQNQTAHVVWVQQSDDGEAPAYAALTSEGGIHLTEEGVLAQAAQEVPVLVAVAADGRSSLLITYRRGDQTTGWSSRYSGGRGEDGTWEFFEEEELPTDSFVGAVDVIYDRQRTAHVVLREDDSFDLGYYEKTAGEPWSEGEIAVHADRVDDIDHPTLSYNAGDGNVYLFFQTEEYDPTGEVSYVVHPLNGTGWQGPFDITSSADAPEGALYPVAPDRVSVQTIVFWTTTGDPYVIDSAPVQAPS